MDHSEDALLMAGLSTMSTIDEKTNEGYSTDASATLNLSSEAQEKPISLSIKGSKGKLHSKETNDSLEIATNDVPNESLEVATNDISSPGKSVASNEEAMQETSPEVDAEAEKKPKNNKNKRKKNAAFEDMEKTGRWGKVSRNEIIIVSAVVMLSVIGIIVGLLLVFLKKESSSTTETPVRPDDVIRPTYSSPEDQYDAILEAVASSDAITSNNGLKVLPVSWDEISEFDFTDETRDPWIRAASWLMYADARPKYVDEIQQRFALVALYEVFRGTEWNQNTNWLTYQHVCDWQGITCVTIPPSSENEVVTQRVLEIDLAGKGLNGRLEDAPLGLLEDSLESVFFSGNKLNGPIPGEVLGAMSKLTFLYLQDNQLTGVIPVSLRNSGALDTLFLYGNMLEGSWPQEFCHSCPTCMDGPLSEFGLDCRQTPCPMGCCSEYENCFNG